MSEDEIIAGVIEKIRQTEKARTFHREHGRQIEALACVIQRKAFQEILDMINEGKGHG